METSELREVVLPSWNYVELGALDPPLKYSYCLYYFFVI